MPSIPGVPFSTIPVESGYDPVTDPFPQDQSIVVLDLVGPAAANRQALTANKRTLTLQASQNTIINALNYLFQGGPSGAAVVIYADGTTVFTANQSMGGHQLNNVLDPTGAQDAATKNYVDATLSELLPLNGSRAATGNWNLNNFKIINSNSPTGTGDLTNKSYVDIQDNMRLPFVGGTMTGAINMGSNKISALANGSVSTDAINLGQLTSALTSYLPLAGGTMAGVISMGSNRMTGLANPTTGSDAINSSWLNTQLANYLALAGGTMGGVINMGNHGIQGLYITPVNPGDAASKNYVDITCLDLAGTRQMTGTLQMGNGSTSAFKVVSMAPGTAGTDAVNVNQLNAQNGGRVISEYVLSLNPTSAYAGPVPSGGGAGNWSATLMVPIPLNASAVDIDVDLHFYTGPAATSDYRGARVMFHIVPSWSGGVITGPVNMNWAIVTESYGSPTTVTDQGCTNNAEINVFGASNTPVILINETLNGESGGARLIYAYITLSGSSLAMTFMRTDSAAHAGVSIDYTRGIYRVRSVT